MPFGRDLAPGMLHRHAGHGEATARITWAITEKALGVVTGEVGVGKTVAARAALAALDPARHLTIYIGNPAIGIRGICHAIVTALGQAPRFHTAMLIPQAGDALATEHAERGRVPVVIIDEAHMLDAAQLEGIRMLTNHDMDSASPFRLPAHRPAHPAAPAQTRPARPPRPADRRPLPHARHDPRRNRRLPAPPPRPRRPLRHPVLRRCDLTDPPDRPRLPPRGQQPRHPIPARRLRRRQNHRRRIRRARRRDGSNDRMSPPPTPRTQSPAGRQPAGHSQPPPRSPAMTPTRTRRMTANKARSATWENVFERASRFSIT